MLVGTSQAVLNCARGSGRLQGLVSPAAPAGSELPKPKANRPGGVNLGLNARGQGEVMRTQVPVPTQVFNFVSVQVLFNVTWGVSIRAMTRLMASSLHQETVSSLTTSS